MVGEDFGFVLFISSMVGWMMEVLPSSERGNGEKKKIYKSEFTVVYWALRLDFGSMRLRAFKKYPMRQNYQSISLQILSLESHTTSIQLQPFAYLPSTKEIHCTLTAIVTKVETLKTFIKRLLTFISCKRQAVIAIPVALDYFLSG
jgi:hypothetical protein